MPFEIATGLQPRYPFDIIEAMWLSPPMDAIRYPELLAAHARQFKKCPGDVETIRQHVSEARIKSIKKFEARVAS